MFFEQNWSTFIPPWILILTFINVLYRYGGEWHNPPTRSLIGTFIHISEPLSWSRQRKVGLQAVGQDREASHCPHETSFQPVLRVFMVAFFYPFEPPTIQVSNRWKIRVPAPRTLFSFKLLLWMRTSHVLVRRVYRRSCGFQWFVEVRLGLFSWTVQWNVRR